MFAPETPVCCVAQIRSLVMGILPLWPDKPYFQNVVHHARKNWIDQIKKVVFKQFLTILVQGQILDDWWKVWFWMGWNIKRADIPVWNLVWTSTWSWKSQGEAWSALGGQFTLWAMSTNLGPAQAFLWPQPTHLSITSWRLSENLISILRKEHVTWQKHKFRIAVKEGVLVGRWEDFPTAWKVCDKLRLQDRWRQGARTDSVSAYGH